MKKIMLLILFIFLVYGCSSDEEKNIDLILGTSKENQSFETSITVKLICNEEEEVKAYYSLDDVDVINQGTRFYNGDEIMIGEENNVGDEIQLNLYAENGEDIEEKTYIYTKIEGTINNIDLILRANKENQSFETSITVKLICNEEEEVEAYYSLNNIDVVSQGIRFHNGDEIMIGDNSNPGDEIKLNLYAKNGENTKSKTYTYKKIDESNNTESSEDFDKIRLYEIMVCSFRDGDSLIGYNWQWNSSALAGGDLQGVIDSLEHIKGLGINAIWLTPVFESYPDSGSYMANQAHNGYFANDYFNIDPEFGTDAKFREFVDKAHEKGIYVILDGVFGHNQGIQIARSPISNISPVSFSGSVNVNYSYANSIKYYQDVAYYWIKEYKIDGWRLDQSY